MPTDPFIGEIFMSGSNFAPNGYVACQGQLLSISQYTALYSLLGTNFGGNGTTTFGVPDLRSRVPVGMGQGPALSVYPLGGAGGVENVTLLTSQIPSHSHNLVASTDAGDVASPAGAFPANTGALDKEYKAALTNATTMNAAAIGSTGSGLPHTNLQPYLALNFYMATEGIYPQRP